jgi:hypothetical protein
MQAKASRPGFSSRFREAGRSVHFMKSRFFSLPNAKTRVIPGLVLIVLLAGCTDTPRWGGWSTAPSQAQIETGLQRLDTYVYFPRYQVYFNAARGRYTFWDGRAWVTGPQPPAGIPAELLQASPSVAMRFTDAPEWHHAEVNRLYPRNWGHAQTEYVSLE